MRTILRELSRTNPHLQTLDTFVDAYKRVHPYPETLSVQRLAGDYSYYKQLARQQKRNN